MGDHYDDLEVREPGRREAETFAALRAQMALAKAKAPYWASVFADIGPEDLSDRSDLAKLPVVRKSDLMAVQAEAPPFGGMTTIPAGDFLRVFRSPGPICEPMGAKPDWFRGARALYAAGFRKGDLVHNTFSYHFTPGAFMMGRCGVPPWVARCSRAASGQTEQQVDAIRHFGAVGFLGTPDFLKIVLDKAIEMEVELPDADEGLGGRRRPLPFPAHGNPRQGRKRDAELRHCGCGSDRL